MILLDKDMPVTCVECDMIYESSDGSIVCSHTNQIINLDSRQEGCPIRGEVSEEDAIKLISKWS